MTPEASPAPPLPRARLHAALRYGAIALAYWGLYLGFSALATFFTNISIVSVWYVPPGLSIALLLLVGPAAAPLIFIAEFLGGWLIWHFPLPVTLLSTLTVGGGYSIGGLILRRVLGGANLRHGSDVMWFVGISMLASLNVAVSTAAVFAYGGLIASSDYALAVYDFWIGDTIGIFLATPFILVIAKPLLAEILRTAPPLSSPPLGGIEGGRTPRAKRGSILRPIWLALAAALLGFLLAWPPTREIHLYYLCFVGIIWVVWNDGLQGAVIGAVVINATARVVSLIAPLESSYEMIEMQIFSVALSALALTLGAMADDRRESERKQKESQAALLHRANELAALHAKAARSLEAEHEQRAIAEALSDVAASLSGTLHLDEVLDRILATMGRVVPHDAANVVLIDPATHTASTVRVFAAPPLDATLWAGMVLPIDQLRNYREMMETGKALVIPDVRHHDGWVMGRGIEWIRSYVGVPIVAKGHTIGFLNLDSATPDFFDQTHAERLQAFADQAAIAIENARLFAATERQTRQLSLLNSVTRATLEASTLPEMLRAVAGWLGELLNADDCAILMWDAASRTMIPGAAYGEYAEMLMTRSIPSTLKAAQEAMNNPQMSFFEAGDEEPRPPFQSVTGLSLAAGGHKFGAALLGYKAARRASPDEIAFAEQLARQVSLAVYKTSLLDSERDQRAMAESLRDVAMAFSANLEMDELFERILINMKRVVPHDRATLMLLEEGIVRVAKSTGYVEPELLATLNTVRFRLANTPILRKMAETGQPTIVADVRNDPDWTTAAGLEWIRSYVGAPISLRGRTVGFLNLDSGTAGYFKPAHLERLRAFAAQAAIAFENSQLYESVRQNAAETSLLYRASVNLFTRDKDLSALAAQIAKTVVDEIKCDHCGVLLIDEDQTNVYLGGQAGIPSIGSPTVISLGGRSVIPTVVREARPIYVPDVSDDPRYLVGNLDARSELVVPLMAAGRVIGVLNLESTRLDGFDKRARRTVFAFAERAALALDDARLFAETTMHARHATALNEIARIGLEQSDLDISLRLFSERLVSLFSADACFIKRWGGERWESSLALAASGSDDYVALHTNMDDMALAENVLRLGNAIAIDSIFDTPLITPRLAASIPARSLLIVPLIAGKLQLGAAFIAFHTHHRFSAQEIARAEQAAAHIALAMAKACLLDETQQRTRELEALSCVSLALRVAPARAPLEPLILEQTSAVLGAQGAALAMRDPVAGNISIESATGVWSGLAGMRIRDDEGVTARIIHSREPYLNNQFHTDEEVLLTPAREGAIAAAGVPLIIQDRALGVLWIASQDCLTDSQMRLLTAIADIAASALHRADLHEKTTRRMQWFSALHDINMAIGATLDLDIILDVLLYQVTTQLGVSAADILLLDPNLQLLEYAAGRGFRTTALRHTRLRLGEGLAGRAALERAIVSIGNLRDDTADLTRAPLLANENFVAYYGVPLVAKGHMRGVLEIFHRSALDSDPEWLSFLEALAAQAAIAIDNAALFGDLQRSVEALQSAQAQLVQAARFTAVGELAAGVAHQINNPLTTVIADAQLMLKATPSDSPIYPSAKAIFQAGWRAQRVVQRLMNFSRPDDGELVPTDVNETVMEALDLVGAHLTRGGADLRVELDPNLPYVLANGHQLEEIWVNLLMNARDALADDRPGVVIVSSRVAASGDNIEVSVADNGRGISEADARQIFTPFFTTKEGGRGNGLGLSVCQTIAHNHGGDITFESLFWNSRSDRY
ncbi:MAG: GAF domain-containing protein [Chloroflexi bacterium]|nr:GAF domain-containing protein [Chloroflexota bacterium]